MAGLPSASASAKWRLIQDRERRSTFSRATHHGIEKDHVVRPVPEAAQHVDCVTVVQVDLASCCIRSPEARQALFEQRVDDRAALDA
jgi:hypothetical protein